jgi:hypothetical protein
MTLRLMVLAAILWIALVALLVSNAAKREDRVPATEAQHPGVWPSNAEAAATAPQMLFAPCPLTPKNLPILPDRRV